MTVDGHDERRTAREHGVLAEHDEFPGRSRENVHGLVHLEARTQTAYEDVDYATNVVQLGGDPVGRLR